MKRKAIKVFSVVLSVLLLTALGGNISVLQSSAAAKVINVKDYTGNHATAIQSAIYDCPSGGTVLIPAGNYSISARINLKSNITLLGQGAETVITADPLLGAGEAMFANPTAPIQAGVYGEKNIKIKDITFIGSRATNRTGVILALNKVENVTVIGCAFKNNQNIAFAVGGSRNVSVLNSFFEGIGYTKPSTTSAPALWVADLGAPYNTPSQNIVVEGSTFQNNNWSGTYFMPVGGRIAGCTFIDNGESSIFTNEKGKSIEYVDNYIKGAKRSNISASGIETGASDSLIEGNYIIDCDASGISLTNLKNTTVKNNFVKHNGQSDKSRSGYFHNPAGMEILSLGLIEGQVNPQDIIISGNYIAKGSSPEQRRGIAIWRDSAGKAVDRIDVNTNIMTYASAVEWISPKNQTEGSGCSFNANSLNQTISAQTEQTFVDALNAKIAAIKASHVDLELEYSLSKTQLIPGEEVELTVSLKNYNTDAAKDIFGLQIAVGLDSNLVDFVAGSAVTLAAGNSNDLIESNYLSGKNEILFMYASTNSAKAPFLKSNKALFKFKVKVKSDISTSTENIFEIKKFLVSHSDANHEISVLDHPRVQVVVNPVSVSITWGSMALTYSGETWNPSNHSYEGGAWTYAEGANKISLTNTSAVSVNVSLSYHSESGYHQINGSFENASNSVISEPFILGEGNLVPQKVDIFLKLQNKPLNNITSQKIGAVTATVS